MSWLLDWFLNKLNIQNKKITRTIPCNKQSNTKMDVCILFVVSRRQKNWLFTGFFKQLKPVKYKKGIFTNDKQQTSITFSLHETQ